MEAAQAALVREVAVVRGVSVEGHGDDWLALASLVAKAQ